MAGAGGWLVCRKKKRQGLGHLFIVSLMGMKRSLLRSTIIDQIYECRLGLTVKRGMQKGAIPRDLTVQLYAPVTHWF